MYKKFQSSNGLKVIVSPMKQMSSVSLGIWIGVGGRYESEKQSGISHFVEHMLFKGTHTRTTKDLKEAIEGVGGAFNGFTSDEVTCYMVKVPSKYMKLGVDILSDMVLDPRFDAVELAREKFVICEEIKMYRDQPSDHVLDMLGELMWPGNSLGRPLTGTIQTVRSFKGEELKKYKKDHYYPGNIGVIAAGNVDPAAIFSYAKNKFRGLKKQKTHTFRPPRVKQTAAQISVLRRDITQSHVAMGFRTMTEDIRERFALKLMNVIFGGNMSSRLFEELREKYGLCYDIASSYKRHSDAGEIQIHAGVDNRKTLKSVIAILDEIKKLRDIGVTEDELERAKRYTKGQFVLAMEGTSTRMLWLGDRLMVHHDIPEVKNVLEKIDAVTIDEVQKVCSKVFTSSAVNLALVGNLGTKDKNRIRKELEKL
ncbi:MAG: pitrilysin family protein [Candidatus Tantalella remota]|nr:pitrilysin family protein [Candidatus Tantalella remota]